MIHSIVRRILRQLIRLSYAIECQGCRREKRYKSARVHFMVVDTIREMFPSAANRYLKETWGSDDWSEPEY